MQQGNLFIISAPSGTGKTTILKRTLAVMKNISFSVSHTTRPPRAGEQEGVAYHFIDKDTFAVMQRDNVFLEWAMVHGNFYGTSKSAILAATVKGRDVILDIDVQGALQVKKKTGGKNVSIFIVPPSLAELEKRLAGRSTETEADITTRLENAREEMNSLGDYDYVIVNDTVDQAVEVLKSIIIAERSRTRRDPSGMPLHLVY
jgi:guanylate kinase